MINIQRVNAETGQAAEVIQLDATLDVNLTHIMSVTSFPVEDGADISDHAQEQPATVTIRSLVSATPLRIFSFNPIIGDARPRAALEIMLELQANRELVRIVTDLKTYDSMALISFNAPRRKDTKNALLFTAVFQEVIVVSSEEVTLPAEEEVQVTAPAKVKGGKITAKPPESAAETDKASLLYRTLQGVGAL